MATLNFSVPVTTSRNLEYVTLDRGFGGFVTPVLDTQGPAISFEPAEREEEEEVEVPRSALVGGVTPNSLE